MSMALRKSLFQDKMSNFTLLKTPYWNIPNRELKTREELSEIRQALYEFGQSIGDKGTDLIIESISDLTFECVELMCILALEVLNSIKTVLRPLCVHFASTLFTHSLPCHSIFTTI